MNLIGRLVLLVIAVVVAVEFFDSDTPSQRSRVTQSAAAFSEPPQVFPISGHVDWYQNRRGDAPLTVQTQSGNNYFLKVVDAVSGQDVLALYIQGGRTARVGLSSGNYIIKYAAGKTWYGIQHYFGPQTGYSKAGKVFDFLDTAYETSGYELTLYAVVGGNMTTQRLTKDQF
jgi:hypothetical protein